MSFLSIHASMLNPNWKNTLMPILSYSYLLYRPPLNTLKIYSHTSSLDHASAYYPVPASLRGRNWISLVRLWWDLVSVTAVEARRGQRNMSWWGQALTSTAPAPHELFASGSCSVGGKSPFAGLECSGKSGDSNFRGTYTQTCQSQVQGSHCFSCLWL